MSYKAKQIGKTAFKQCRKSARSAYWFVVENPNCALFLLGVALVTLNVMDSAYADGKSASGAGSAAGADAGSGGGSLSGASSASGGGSAQGALGAAGGGAVIDGNATQACSRAVGYIEGGFGTLIASAAGLGAIVSAALGGFKAAWCLFVVSVGCFILRSYLYLFLTGC